MASRNVYHDPLRPVINEKIKLGQILTIAKHHCKDSVKPSLGQFASPSPQKSVDTSNAQCFEYVQEFSEKLTVRIVIYLFV